MYVCFHLILRKRETLVESFCISISTSDEKMVEKLRPDELASFREAFDTFDKNSDGTISTKVTLHALRLFDTFHILNLSGTACSNAPCRTEPNRVRSSRYD